MRERVYSRKKDELIKKIRMKNSLRKLFLFFAVCNTVAKLSGKKFADKKRGKGRNKTTILTYQSALLQFKRRYMLMYMSVCY